MKLYKVLMSPSSKKDVVDARKWYQQFNYELPLRFKEDVKKMVAVLKLRPHVHAVRYKEVRIANMRSFPYAVHYFIDEGSATVNIIAVHHSAINPSAWNSRLK